MVDISVLCPNCGESMEGDGYTTVYHCPNTTKDICSLEPDANPVHCIAEEEILPAYAWPGGYTLCYLAADSEILCNVCATAEEEPVEQFVHWEGEPLYCAECNKEMESSYGIPDEE